MKFTSKMHLWETVFSFFDFNESGDGEASEAATEEAHRSCSGGEPEAGSRDDYVSGQGWRRPRMTQQASSQETRGRGNRETKERSPRHDDKAKEREQCEIQNREPRVIQEDKKTNQEPPSRAFQEALLETQAEPTKVTSQTIDLDLGLEVTKELNKVRNAEISVDEDRMDLDAVIEEGEEKQSTLKEGKERAPGDAGKKQGIRRGAFVAGGSSKMQMVQTMLANPKKNAAKTITRHGEGLKQGEEKGLSHSNLALPKP
ncbi:hypothetical protein Bca52824_033929 [Brassica carinata]|uniref:Uncharacterized protein n=1 Tax=Brassica carinata TaxID=52824 RepID=A0A8X7SFH9_BRACI|nr:hypothetical protein Bca52824_033929 [Brassica carinata]